MSRIPLLPPTPQLQSSMVVSRHVDVGNRTLVLWKNSQYP